MRRHLAGRLAPILALLVPLMASAQPPRVGEVLAVRNQVLGTPPAGATVPLATGDALVLRHQIETLADSAARMSLGEDGNLALGAQTTIILDQVVLGRAGGASRLSLLLGSLRLKLGELFRGEMEIDTPTAVIGIKGTDVQVEVYPGVTVVTVFEGVVTVLGKLAGEAVEVAAGQRSVVQGGRPPTRPAQAELPLGEGGGALGVPGPPAARPGSPAVPTPAPPVTRPAGSPSTPPAPPTREPSQPSAPPPSAGPPAITGCSPGGQAGEAVCVCGRFPDQRSAAGLTLDGRPLEVLSTSPGRVDVRLPASLAAGEHVIAGGHQAGFARGDRCPVGVLVLEAEYKEHLKQGRATQLILRVHGTREPVKIRVQNLTPRIVRVKGGTDQVVTTRGGRKNQVKLRVKATGDGYAQIRRQILGLASCPCPAGPDPGPG